MGGRRIHYVDSLHQSYGSFVRISPTEIAVNDVKGFKQIHGINSGFEKSPWYGKFTTMERPALFTMTNATAHAARRRMFARAFSKSHIRQHWEWAIREKVELAVFRIREQLEQQEKVDVLKWWKFMASDASAHLMFGESFGTLQRGEANEYLRVMDRSLKGGGIGAEMPIVREIGRRLPWEAAQHMFSSIDFLMEYAKVAVENMKAGGGGKNIFANILAESEKGDQLEERDVQIEASGLIVAGSDTTAITLTYLVWVVLSRPELQAALEQEVAALPTGYHDVDVEALPLLNAVIEETLRLFGAAPGGLPRVVPNQGAELGGYWLPRGTTVTTQSYSLHRDPNLFPEPYEFKPSRWQASTESGNRFKLSEAAKSVYTPFGAGSRACLGIHLAYMELRLSVAEFFRRCPGARLAPSITPESMRLENFFLIAPAAHKCEITM